MLKAVRIIIHHSIKKVPRKIIKFTYLTKIMIILLSQLYYKRTQIILQINKQIKTQQNYKLILPARKTAPKILQDFLQAIRIVLKPLLDILQVNFKHQDCNPAKTANHHLQELLQKSQRQLLSLRFCQIILGATELLQQKKINLYHSQSSQHQKTLNRLKILMKKKQFQKIKRHQRIKQKKQQVSINRSQKILIMPTKK
ncbi:transmembrane protein, putative (macronuclear) [Tetrahymena thermophila SB210]|uniref:Transmembrane protein, putative n=1 Tax=Tetrahymena thermophila (strain SB210) TaxID=312017 RepID=W7X3X5_TETTS|nr:transmembrane protein, putative [Tetrahymena thermophila SB210]EWS74015.1 transmembrane protein, putative [Tetrahymena thermophila SB210]|eukprot:XP_012653477.1 transmembrane protein, putative [Tetrahymena thermophila SB210]